MKQRISGNGDLYTPGHCNICRDSEHGDYGDGIYTRVKHVDYENNILLCSDHYDFESEYNSIQSTGDQVKREIPENETDEA